jgi:predicted GNAT family acetyltransferase
MHPLDRPIWTAMQTRQAFLAAGDAHAQRFPGDVSPFAAARDTSPEAIAALAALLLPGEEFALLETAFPDPPPGIAMAIGGLCFQMIATSFTAGGRDIAYEPLGDEDAAEMYDLAMLTRPGPFRARTHTLGRFIGVRDQGRLVAMAGERLNTDEFREISAVCTHPDYRGRGYGAALMRAVGARILADGQTPFLHTYANNETAIALYKSLGFAVRTEITHFAWKRD